jgi:aminoglycoside phosphotransferase (APT) family kinase protein
MAETDLAGLSPALVAWVEAAAGARPTHARRLSGGGSRHTILVDARRPDGSAMPLVLRLEGGGSHSGTSFSLEREYHVYRALAGRDVPVPKAYGLTPDGSALLMERLEGDSEFRQAEAAVQARLAQNFMQALGRMHAIPARDLELPGFDRPRTAEEHATVDLARWEALARGACWDEPLVRFAIGRLKVTAPQAVQRTVLVQGDTGPGNFMATDDRVTGLIDWEFSHVGDPMDDLGWLKYRSRELFGLFQASSADYERISGLRIEPASVDYYFRMAVLRCAVTVALGKAKGGALGVIPYRFAFQTYLAQLADLLVADAALEVARDPAPEAGGPTSPLYAEARGELRNFVLNAIPDHRGRIAAQAAMTALTSLELRERFGRQMDELDREDRKRLLGDGVESLADAAEDAGAVGDSTMLSYLARKAWRERSLWPR